MYNIETDDEIWHWLDEGTNIRRVGSDPNDPYISKTQPGIFPARPGGGSLFFLPEGDVRPGIEARNWSEDPKAVWTAKQLLISEWNKQKKRLRQELKNG